MTRDATAIEAETYRSRVRGCLMGGAIGDALGAPVEYQRYPQILAAHGDRGVRTFPRDAAGRSIGTVTDDTQMALFTAEGLIRAGVRTDRGIGFSVGVVHNAYDRWLDTQDHSGPTGQRDGWLQEQVELYVQRGPGATCLSALREARGGHDRLTKIGVQASNNSKGCGGVMRVAPVGLTTLKSGTQSAPLDWYFDVGAEVAGYTHGHVTGRLASGALAVLVRCIVLGNGLEDALDSTLEVLVRREGHEETTQAVVRARELAADGNPSVEEVESLGGGWIAEEALAIAVYSALSFREIDEVLDALSLAVTHSGDSDSTGAICGSILGALHGETGLPPELVFGVDLRGIILQLADDFILEFTERRRLHGDYGPNTGWTKRYPGG